MNEEEKIVSHSIKIFIKNGFHKTTMDQLASGLGVSKKTIYKYFPSKLSLVKKAIETSQNKIKKDLENIIESDKCLIEKLKEVGSYFAQFSLKINKKLFNDFFIRYPELWNKVDDFRATVIKNIWEKLINDGKKEGLIINESNKIIIAIIQSSIRGIINPRFLTKNDISLNNAFEQMFTILMNGILTEKGKIKFEKQKWKK